MGFFNKKTQSYEEEIANSILEQEDHIGTLFGILNHLPTDLVEWFKGIIKTHESTKGYVEVDISSTINSNLILPGDLVIRKNRDPKIGDIVEIGIRALEGYAVQMVKIIKINLKEGTVLVENLIEPENQGNISIGNIICVVDKIIKYEDNEWKKIVNSLNIDYDISEIEKWLKDNIEYLKKTENFFDRENNIKKMNDRLKVIKKK